MYDKVQAGKARERGSVIREHGLRCRGAKLVNAAKDPLETIMAFLSISTHTSIVSTDILRCAWTSACSP